MNNGSDKKLCGLRGEHVVVSPHNDNGECKCIGCFGMHCYDCTKYQELIAEIEALRRPTRCQLCRGNTR